MLTTAEGAQRLNDNATGLEPGDGVEVDRPDGGSASVTAVRADHGPPEVAPKNGPVIGFIVRGDDLPSLYVSGDNASVDVVREIVAEHSPIDVAVLFVGGAQVPEAWGNVFLTLSAEGAVEAARALGDAPIVPIHQDGWAHFTSSPDDLRVAFERAGLSDRLRLVEPGGQVVLQ